MRLYIATIVVVLLAGLSVLLPKKAHSADPPQPFSAVLVETIHGIQVPPQTSERVVGIRDIAVRFDGSWSRSTTVLTKDPSQSYKTRKIMTTDGLYRDVHDQPGVVSTVRTTFLPFGEDPGAGCLHPSMMQLVAASSHEKYMGLDVIKYVMKPLQGGAQATFWISPALHCLTAQQDVLTPNNSRSTLALQSYTFGEPLASYFDVPASYPEMKPSDAHAAFQAWRKTKDPACCADSADVALGLLDLDVRYAAKRP